MTTTISPVKINSNTQRGKQIGTTIGAGVATGYIAKNAKALFLDQIPQMAVESGASKKVGYAASGIAATIVAGGIIGAGRLIGAGIGKIADMIKQHKAIKETKEVLAEALTKNENSLKEIKPISVDELDKISKMSDEEAIEYFGSLVNRTSEE